MGIFCATYFLERNSIMVKLQKKTRITKQGKFQQTRLQIESKLRVSIS